MKKQATGVEAADAAQVKEGLKTNMEEARPT
jgi:hypothetical protein